MTGKRQTPFRPEVPRRRLLSAVWCQAAAFVLFLGTPDARAGEDFEACRITEAPAIDGRLDDACWADCPAITAFTQVLPREGTDPSEKTEVRVGFDDENVFFAVRCWDSEPSRILASQMRHDASLGSDDYVYIAIDTFGRARDGYYFAVNPAGARQDGLIGDFNHRDSRWDALWTARTRIDDIGWTAEIAIPFNSLSFDPDLADWRWNVQRTIRRNQESVRLHAISRAKNVTSLADMGPLPGVRGKRTGLGLEVRPGITVTYEDERGKSAATEIKPSVDLTYQLTPSIKANATFNTDFAEAEVDDRVINLSRFPLFFPEKRDFFLQDAPLFSFGGVGREALPFYSRRIGRGASSEPVDLQAGLRLTGRAGPNSIALLGARQDAEDEVDASTLLVGRLSTQVSSKFTAGMIGTQGNPTGNTSNSLIGVDASWHDLAFLDNNELLIRGYLQRTDSEARGGGDYAWGADIDFPNEPLDVHLLINEVGENYDPALGFVSRRGIRSATASARYVWRPNTKWVRSFSVQARPEVTTDLDNRIVAEDLDFLIFRIYTPAVDSYSFGVGDNFDLVEEPFSLLDKLEIQTGEYRFTRMYHSINTSSSRPLSFEAFYSFGDYYTGTRVDYGMDLEWRPSRFFNFSAGQTIRNIQLESGELNVHVAHSRVNISFTPDLSWSTRVQYDNQSRDLSVNSRVRWTYRPGGDIYFVVNNGWNQDIDDRFRSIGSGIALKAGSTFRF